MNRREWWYRNKIRQGRKPIFEGVVLLAVLLFLFWVVKHFGLYKGGVGG